MAFAEASCRFWYITRCKNYDRMKVCSGLGFCRVASSSLSSILGCVDFPWYVCSDLQPFQGLCLQPSNENNFHSSTFRNLWNCPWRRYPQDFGPRWGLSLGLAYQHHLDSCTWQGVLICFSWRYAQAVPLAVASELYFNSCSLQAVWISGWGRHAQASRFS